MIDPTPYRSLFPVTERWAFFNHAGVSSLNSRAVAAMHEFSQSIAHESFTTQAGPAIAMMADLRQRFATLINAASIDEIVLMPNTATGLNTAAVSLPLQAGDNVLVLEGDYPANIYPWQQLALRGVLCKIVPAKNGGLDLDTLAARIDRRTRAIALSTVQFATGFRNDLAAVGQLCQERGIFFVVDGIQSLGALPLDVQAANIDMLACGAQKWLLGPMGGGFLYVRRSTLEQLQPGAYVGAASTVDWMNFLDYNLTPLPTAERFNLGSPNFVGYCGLHASLTLLQEVGIAHVAERVLALAGLAIDELKAHGFQVSPDTAEQHRSGIVIAEVANPPEAAKRLEQHGFIVVARGNGVRIAPHFYNTADEVRAVVAALSAG
ncbi:MAG: aminotransferase class V-fold PLP-dependent enzyme [Roseiflexaceae bacterium]|nr:aminotransferase class V-fold PLP-dependent enzyme [Roseiflexaceae bacterium]